MVTDTTVRMPGTPKPWMNAIVSAALRVPLVRGLLGGTFAVITVTGARTGRRYSTPVQYVRDGERYVVLSQVTRRWWRNLRSRPEVELLVHGVTIGGVAVVAEGRAARPYVEQVLTAQPRTARFYGIAVDDDGRVDPDGLDALCERVVAVVVDAVHPEP
jgi:deazaflavin-dependent oxidoreductase (nitroreductase family)